jgi:hypothetical protein
MMIPRLALAAALLAPAFTGCGNCIDCNRTVSVNYVHTTVRDTRGPVAGVIVFAGQAHFVQQGTTESSGAMVFQILDPLPVQLLGVTGKVPLGYVGIDTSFVQLRDSDTVVVSVNLE